MKTAVLREKNDKLDISQRLRQTIKQRRFLGATVVEGIIAALRYDVQTPDVTFLRKKVRWIACELAN